MPGAVSRLEGQGWISRSPVSWWPSLMGETAGSQADRCHCRDSWPDSTSDRGFQLLGKMMLETAWYGNTWLRKLYLNKT